MKKMIEEVENLQKEIDEKFGRRSGAVFFLVDMVQEVGELAEVIRAKEFYKRPPKEVLEDEIGDIFYSLVGVAKNYNVNMEDAIKNRIIGLKKRFSL
ncbi:MAG TPA: hypothetical protein ENN58_02160 [bacterium]|nr:hypothetical protein [bacterium]